MLTYNEAGLIERKLDNIYEQEYPRDRLEVVVVDSISEDTRLYWRENGVLRFGTVGELYRSFARGAKIEVLSVGKRYSYNFNPRAMSNPYPSMKTAEVAFAEVRNVFYGGVKPVWRVTLRNGKCIEVTEGHSPSS